MDNQYDKWADEIFSNALNEAQGRGFKLPGEGSIEAEIKSREEEISRHAAAMEELQSTLRKELNDVKKKLVERDIKEKPKEIKDLQTTRVRLETAVKHLKNKLEVKQVELEEKEKRFTDLLKEKLEEKADDFKKWQEMENFNLTEKIRIQNEEIKSFQDKLRQSQAEARGKESELVSVRDLLKKEREHWMETVTIKEKEIKDLRASISGKEGELEEKKKYILDLETQRAKQLGEAKEKELRLIATAEHLEKEVEFLSKLLDDEKSAIIKAGMIKREARLKAEQYAKEAELKTVRLQLDNFAKKVNEEKVLWQEKLENREHEIKHLRSEIENKERKLTFVEESLDQEMRVRRSREEEKLMIKSQLILGEAGLKAKHTARQRDLFAIKVALERERESLKKRLEEERKYLQSRMEQVVSNESEMKKKVSAVQKEYEELEHKLIDYEKEMVLKQEQHKTWEEIRENQIKEEYQKKLQQLDKQDLEWKEERIDVLKKEIELENEELEKKICKE
ncbi:MAG: hypothetical protein JW983_00210 [Elusimicrobia bacterium]|nr:hypothetical protein [Elusimicrobiota bacterium]